MESAKLKEIRVMKESERQRVILTEDAAGNRYIKREIDGDKTEIFKTLQKINHPAVPKILFVGFDDGTTVLEEYIEGETLSACMEQNRPLRKKEIRSITKQVLSALHTLHLAGIIHKDVKPDNILRSASGRIWLTDYDIARIYRSEVRKDTETMGTFGYAPIEQFGMMPTDFKTDIYAFGVTLQTLLDYARYKGALYRVAEKCRRLDPALRYKSAEKVRRSIFLRTWALPVLCVSVFLLAGAVLLFTRPDDNAHPAQETVRVHPAEASGSLSSPSDAPREVHLPAGSAAPFSAGTAAEPTPDATPETMPAADFAGTFSGFADGPKEAAYKNNRFYSQVLIFTSNTPREHLLFIDDVRKTGRLKLGNDAIIDADFALQDGRLSVQLQDAAGHSFSRSFQFDGQYTYTKSHTEDLRKNADIICYDFNGDGKEELLIGLNEGVMGAEGGQFYNHFNYCIAWVIQYDADAGFSLCADDMFSKSYAFQLNESTGRINISWEDFGDATGYIMQGNTIQSVF